MDKGISIRLVDIDQDFGQLAAFFTLDDEPISEPALVEDYEAQGSYLMGKILSL